MRGGYAGGKSGDYPVRAGLWMCLVGLAQAARGAFRAISARSAVMASSWRRRSASRASWWSFARSFDERRISRMPRQIRKQAAAAPRPVTSAMATVAQAVMRAGFSVRSPPQVHFGQSARGVLSWPHRGGEGPHLARS